MDKILYYNPEGPDVLPKVSGESVIVRSTVKIPTLEGYEVEDLTVKEETLYLYFRYKITKK